MLVKILLSSIFYVAVEGLEKPYVLPIPFDLPNRNDRADQCWLRIEDDEIIETVAVYCHIAHAFLQSHVRDYNSKKMTQDDVEVSLWREDPGSPNELDLPKVMESNGHKIKDWKVATVKDPIMRMRLYVSLTADCHLVMYSREGMTNYKVDCAKVLYYVNHMSGSSVTCVPGSVLTLMCIFLAVFNHSF